MLAKGHTDAGRRHVLCQNSILGLPATGAASDSHRQPDRSDAGGANRAPAGGSLDGQDGPKLNRRLPIDLLISVAIFAFTALVFFPVCRNGFVAWDDHDYVYQQPKVLQGLNASGFLWALTSSVSHNWHPVTMWSLQLDAQLFGTDAYGFHRTSLLMHALNAALAFWTLLTLTNRRWESAVVALLFALHPLRVEAVAWVSERKELLGGLFFFLTILGYASYVRSPSWGRYLLVMLCLALGLASKSMLVTLPCVLLLLDYWPLRRLRNWPDFKAIVLEKIPLFALSAAFSVITVMTQEKAMQTWPLSRRLANGVLSYPIYIRQTFWPMGLTGFYGRYEIKAEVLFLAVAILLAVTAIALWQCRNRPYLIVGWFWFLGMLVPVSGVIQVGKQVHADRYTYLPQIGLLVALIWLASEFTRGFRWRTFVVGGVLTAYASTFVVITQQLIPLWRNTETLFSHAIRSGTGDLFLICALMLTYFSHGETDKAVALIPDFVDSPDYIDPGDIKPMTILAAYLSDLGRNRESLMIYDRLQQEIPRDVTIIANRGKAKAAAGDWRGAVEDYRLARQLNPKNDSYPFYLAHALQQAGEPDAAMEAVKTAIKQSPNWPKSAIAIARESIKEQIPMYFWPICLAEQANLATGGNDPEVLDVLASVYAHAGRYRDAVATERSALEKTSGLPTSPLKLQLQKQLELFEKRLADQSKNERSE